MSPTVVFCRRPRDSFAFPNRHRDMHTPHMMMSISKSLPRNSRENPEQVANREDGTGLQTSTPDRISPGVRMDANGVMEISVNDGLDVNYKTRPLLPSSPAAKGWPHTSAPHSRKS